MKPDLFGNRGAVDVVASKILTASSMWSISAMEYGTALAIALWDLISLALYQGKNEHERLL